MPSNAALTELQSQWTTLYRTTLPQLAKARSPIQPNWPVHLDHCFARIILDNAIGEGSKPWTSIIKAPAVRNMSTEQLASAIKLGTEIVDGRKNLAQLDRVSLMARGKEGMIERKRKRSDEDRGTASVRAEERCSKKTKQESSVDDGSISKYFLPSPKKSQHPAVVKKEKREEEEEKGEDAKTKTKPSPQPSQAASMNRPSLTASPESHSTAPSSRSSPDPLTLIRNSDLTPFRKLVLSLLCDVPPGRYTTYAAMSAYITSTSPKPTCARAVGNALRNNPFAPMVPCHRVLASDGRIGGFGGDWGEEGRFAGEKVRLLREEGVRFDGKGKVVGAVWRGWVKDNRD
ncbi:hypothetical protein MBLNU459_g5322t1 [Dothideomycetes sp. NU459]